MALAFVCSGGDKPSEISREIEADIWSDENIQVLKDSLARFDLSPNNFSAQRQLIEVYEGDLGKEKLLYQGRAYLQVK